MLMCSLVLTHLDYSNAILVNSPNATIKQFQFVQNFGANIVINKRKQDWVTECLKELHWIPVRSRCIYKLLTILYNSLRKEGPTHLQTILNVKYSQRSAKNSAQDNDIINLVTPFKRRKIYADHGFTFTAAQQWSKMPSHIRKLYIYKGIKKHHKTHLDTQTFK